MSRTYKDSRGPGRTPRQLSVRGVRRDPPDVRKLARALIALAQAQAEADAEANLTKHTPAPTTSTEAGTGSADALGEPS